MVAPPQTMPGSLVSSTFAPFAPRARRPVEDAAPSRPAARSWAVPLPVALRWAAVFALCMSTQYLFQPFVWKYWPVADVLLGWLEVVRDRVLMAFTIALSMVGAGRVPARRASARAALLAAAIIAGAIAGELALLVLDSPDVRGGLRSTLGRAVQWIGLALCVSGICYLWLRENDAQAAVQVNELRRSTTEALFVRTQLQSLRQQIEPHFLFNTLATIRRLRETAPEEGGRLLRHLLDYLRSTMPSAEHRTTLGEEVDLAASYLAIVAIRMSGALSVRFEVPAALRGCECPPLTLATLVENAVKHGITPSPESGEIAVRARRDGDTLEIVVADTGVGFGPSSDAVVGGTGIGLANTRARLRALYGHAATLSIDGNAPRGVCAVVRLPLRKRCA